MIKKVVRTYYRNKLTALIYASTKVTNSKNFHSKTRKSVRLRENANGELRISQKEFRKAETEFARNAETFLTANYKFTKCKFAYKISKEAF